MKLTIKSDNQIKIIDLNKDLELSAVKGEQYVFSNEFTNYTLNFKDDQQTVSLQFNVDGKVIKIDLKGIVPFLQENSSDIENPTAIIINKSVNENNIENIIQNDVFNGSEIIDKLEALITNSEDLGKDLTLISDFQTLIEALDAAAAGGEQGGNNTNGSSFNSIFSPLEDSLNDIGETDIWENLSESISSIPVDTGTPIGAVAEFTPIVNVNVKLFPVKTEVIEGENAIYKVTLTDDAGNPIIAIENIEVTFTYIYTTASGDDIIEVKSVIIPAGSSEITFEVETLNDNIYEITEEFTIEIETVSNQEQFGTVTIDKTPVLTVINDEDDNNPDTPDVPTDGDKPVVSIVATDAIATEGITTDTATFKISQTNTSNFDTKVKVTLNLTEITKEDISKVEYTDANGDTVTLTSSQIDALVAGTFEVVIPKGSTGTPSFTFTAKDDDIYEISEGFGLSISNAENATLGTSSATAVINDEDDNNPDTPDVPTDGDKPVLIITGSTVTEIESGISTGEKVIGRVEISISNGKVFAEDLNIILSTGQVVTIKAGETTTGPINVETNRIDDYYKQGTTTYDVSIQEVSNSKIDITGKTATITINDDIDPIGIEITATATAPKIIDVNTEFDDLTGVKISATDTDGNPKNISVVTGTNHDGFGVEGNTTGSGASSELGNLGNGKSEKLVFEFEKDINSLDIAFAWRHNGETARVTFINDGNIIGYAEVKGGGSNTKAKVNYYTVDGELIRTVEAQGGTDRVDLSYTFELVNSDGSLASFDQVEFTAPNHDDDYLINKIAYKEVLNPEITDVSADGGSVTFDIQLQHPPQGNATAKIEVNGVVYNNVVINATGRATLTVDGKDLGDLSNVVIKVLEINGGNYEKVNSVEKTFDFTPVLKSSDDSITTNEDESYILKVTDFGEVSINTKEFKITELPNPESGKLYLIVKHGETIIDKEGNISVATQDTKIEIFENQIIKLADIGAGKVVFEPKANSDVDGDFKFEVGDGKGKFSEEYTTVIEVIAVSDEPIATIDITKVASSSTEYKIDISAALADIDGSEALTVKISGVPEGTTFDLANITNLGNGVWEVIVPNGVNSIDYKDIKMNVPTGTNYVDLTITARATELNDNTTGNNYVESNSSDATIYGINEAEQANMKAFKYNLVLTIDNSGSMKGDKITLAKAAMVNLVNKYTELGEVKVLLNVFNSYGEVKGVWVSASQAINIINAIVADGGTNYDDALLKNIDALTKNPAPLDGKTISYFVSDGVPTYGMYKNSKGEWKQDGNGYETTDINDTIIDQWKNLKIDKTYSVGVGTSQLNEYMREISQNPNEDVIIINNANQLSQTLEDTVQELLVEGNVLNNILGGDGEISVENINFGGTIYTKDNFPQDGLFLENNKIKFTFDFETGEYKYYAKSSTFVEEVKTFTVNAVDSNGDRDSFNVSADVKITQGKSENIQKLMGEDIDLSTVITKTTDIIDMENSSATDKIKVELQDILDLNNKELVIRGDLGDIVELDKPATDWVKGQTQQIDGKNYNVYTNATVKLLIEDDIDVIPDI